MTNEKAEISLNGVKLKDQYQNDDYIWEVTEIINFDFYSKIKIQSLCKTETTIFIVFENNNSDWLVHDFKKVPLLVSSENTTYKEGTKLMHICGAIGCIFDRYIQWDDGQTNAILDADIMEQYINNYNDYKGA